MLIFLKGPNERQNAEILATLTEDGIELADEHILPYNEDELPDAPALCLCDENINIIDVFFDFDDDSALRDFCIDAMFSQ